MKSLLVAVVISVLQLVLSQDENAAELISPNSVLIHAKAIFGLPVQYTEVFTPARVLIKGGDVVAVFCHGNEAMLMDQAVKGSVDDDGYRIWTVRIETNVIQVTKLMSFHPIYCNMINNSPKPEIIPFSLTYTTEEGVPVLKPVVDPSVNMDKMIHDVLKSRGGVSSAMIGLMVTGAIIIVIVPIVLGVINKRRIIT